jgi:hypothetical protein
MRSLLLLASLALASSAVAQNNYFDIYSGCTNYTSRGTLGTNAGEVLLQIPRTAFQGVCQDAGGTGTLLNQFQYVTQDQNGSTQETYFLVVRRDDPVTPGAPDITAAGLLLRAGPLLTPATTILTPVAWIITATLATPSTVLPLCDTYYHGMEVAAAPGWTGDGQSVHICTYYNLGGTQADNPAPIVTGFPDPINVAWDHNFVTMVAAQPSTRSIRLALGSAASVLNMGNVDPTAPATNCVSTLGGRSWGAGGMFPAGSASGRSPRDDGLDARVKDVGSASGVFQLFMSDTSTCPGLPLSFLASGALYLNVGLLIPLGSGVLDATGLGTTTVIPPGTVVPASIINRDLPFQAFTVGPSFTLPGKLSNKAATRYL